MSSGKYCFVNENHMQRSSSVLQRHSSVVFYAAFLIVFLTDRLLYFIFRKISRLEPTWFPNFLIFRLTRYKAGQMISLGNQSHFEDDRCTTYFSEDDRCTRYVAINSWFLHISSDYTSPSGFNTDDYVFLNM